ncbi:VOC family protein [Salicibibacter cibarius]|uniref:VOC family protein n=1 Tax=Salicibibacter cibarius TaxID=2743000 RepID=A0A7T7CBW7_9BACI|nr:VOC family protein [Salicibibacter cibarius]QQK76295.1 VOC family protein [Salicibibacter cibarius]
MKQVNPYLNFDGNCEEAFTFYQSIFGGEPQLVRFNEMKDEMPGLDQLSKEDGEKIANIALPIGANTTLMGDDGKGVFGHGVTAGNMFMIEIEPESAEETDKLFNALSEGGEVKMPIAETTWAEKFGQCMDKYGVQWMFSYAGSKEKNLYD